MTNENGEWIIRGLSVDAPDRIKSAEELIDFVNEIGFLPLFQNEIEGFSVEEHAASDWWWTGEAEDPWEWREICAKSRKIAYGKFFGGRAGFISLKWLPYFANYRRDGYDFDSLHDDGKANSRQKKIMDLFEDKDEWFSYELKRTAGFGKYGEKNFEGTLTSLQMMIYLVVCDFRCKLNKKGQEYGMRVAQYSMPEKLWNYDAVTAAYSEDPEKSKQRIIDRVKELYPSADDKAIKRVCL